MPRGQKTCPKCGTTCGPRTRECPAAACDHQFPIKGKNPSPPAERPTPGPPSIGPPSLSKPPEPPSIPSKVKPGDTCVVHKKYTATNVPKVDCEACWRMYLRDRFGDQVRPLDEALTVIAADPCEIDRFIIALKEARDNNRHGGGGYAAFFHVDDEVVLRFDVQVPIGELPYGRKRV